MQKNYKSIISVILISISVISCVYIHYYAFGKTAIYIDTIYHFYDMKDFQSKNITPAVGNRLTNNDDVRDNSVYARIPGGFYYILYTLCYKLGGYNTYNDRIIYIMLCALVSFIFIFWIKNRFGIFISAIISSLLLTNGYFVFSTNDFWNPSITLVLSLLLFILFFEYVKDLNYKTSFIAAIFIFPVEALMAQGHIAVFFSIIPTTIVYLIIRYKKTLKYIKAYVVGIFISFLLYLHYLIYEFQNGFTNIKMMLSMQSTSIFKGLPQVYSIFLFPTNEISVLYGTNKTAVMHFWFNNNKPFIIGMIFLVITLLLSLVAFIYSIVYLVKKIKNSSMEIEGFIFYLLFIPVTCISFLLFKSTPGTFRYLYGIFAFSYIPIIILFSKFIEHRKKLVIISAIILCLNAVEMSFFHLKRYYNIFEASYNQEEFRKVVDAISKDSNGKSFKIIPEANNLYYNNMALAYFPETEWRENSKSDLVYFIYDEIDNVRTKSTGKRKCYDDILNSLTEQNSVKLYDNNRLKAYRIK